MKIKENIRNEIHKISEMDKRSRWEYYKSYYKWPSIVVIIGLVLLIWFIKDTAFQKEEVSMGCAFGLELTDRQREALTDGYMEYYGYNPKKCTAYVATDNMFADTAQQMDAYSNTMALYAQIAAGQIYYLILDRATMESMNDGGIYAGLSEIFTEEYLKDYEDAIVYLQDSESGSECKAAIDLRKLGFLSADQEGYLLFTIARPDEDYPKRLLEFLKEQS